MKLSKARYPLPLPMTIERAKSIMLYPDRYDEETVLEAANNICCVWPMSLTADRLEPELSTRASEILRRRDSLSREAERANRTVFKRIWMAITLTEEEEWRNSWW